jgi:ABC-type sugar transport system permease subunit
MTTMLEDERTAAAAQAPPRRKVSFHRHLRELVAVAGFLLPMLILIVVLRIVPAFEAVSNSMHSGLPGSIVPPEFVGFDLYQKLFTSESFWSSLTRTLIFSAIINPLQIVLALLVAVLLTRGLPLTGLWRTLIFLPAAIPMTGAAIVWGFALRPDGPVNGLLEAVGIPAQPFLLSPGQSMASIILIASWIGVGYWMIFLVAGLHDIPEVYYEAARIDGAGPVRTFFSITLPLLKRPLLLVLVADTVANFVLFAPIQILTGGGPQKSTSFLMYDVFHRTYVLTDPYLASAELVVLLVIMIAIVALQFRLLRSKDD